MGERTAISWTDHTFNPWWGCQRVSPGCEHCYAETFSKRVGLKLWGPASDRRFFGDAHWKEPFKWAKQSTKDGRVHRVFCASMADVFEDRRDLDASRDRLWDLIEQTPNLDWQILTKRPENILRLGRWLYSEWPDNVWLGTTAEDQAHYAKRWPLLAKVPARVRFISHEPALGPMKLVEALSDMDVPIWPDWVITGGESGPGARPYDIEWAHDLIRSAPVDTRVFVKQLGAKPHRAGVPLVHDPMAGKSWTMTNRWPESLRVQEFPNG